jgi:vacuolar-type H+-ATPase subunit E/Vma4
MEQDLIKKINREAEIKHPQNTETTPATQPPEQEPRIEQTKERAQEQLRSQEKSTIDTTAKRKFHLPTLRKQPVVIPHTRDEVTERIEKVLEEGVGEAFQKLSPIAKEEFKLKGERTAYKIRELLQDSHVKAKKIFQLILEWLKFLPGINRFFIEQEAKIKTDKIIMLKNRQ